LEEVKKHVITIKEGASYKLQIDFRVSFVSIDY